MNTRPLQHFHEKLDGALCQSCVSFADSADGQPSQCRHGEMDPDLDIRIVRQLWKPPHNLCEERPFPKVLRLLEQAPLFVGKKCHTEIQRSNLLVDLWNGTANTNAADVRQPFWPNSCKMSARSLITVTAVTVTAEWMIPTARVTSTEGSAYSGGNRLRTQCTTAPGRSDFSPDLQAARFSLRGRHAPNRLMDLLRAACQGRHLSPRTEEAYCHWARRFIVHSRMQHPATLGPD